MAQFEDNAKLHRMVEERVVQAQIMVWLARPDDARKVLTEEPDVVAVMETAKAQAEDRGRRINEWRRHGKKQRSVERLGRKWLDAASEAIEEGRAAATASESKDALGILGMQVRRLENRLTPATEKQARRRRSSREETALDLKHPDLPAPRQPVRFLAQGDDLEFVFLPAGEFSYEIRGASFQRMNSVGEFSPNVAPKPGLIFKRLESPDHAVQFRFLRELVVMDISYVSQALIRGRVSGESDAGIFSLAAEALKLLYPSLSFGKQ